MEHMRIIKGYAGGGVQSNASRTLSEGPQTGKESLLAFGVNVGVLRLHRNPLRGFRFRSG